MKLAEIGCFGVYEIDHSPLVFMPTGGDEWNGMPVSCCGALIREPALKPRSSSSTATAADKSNSNQKLHLSKSVTDGPPENSNPKAVPPANLVDHTRILARGWQALSSRRADDTIPSLYTRSADLLFRVAVPSWASKGRGFGVKVDEPLPAISLREERTEERKNGRGEWI